MIESLSEYQVLTLLKAKYPAPEYILLPQVRNQTGYARIVRTADALMMSTYPSRGIFMYGFEIKSSRYDWTKEFKNPDKADEIAKYCDFWYVVTGAKDIVKPDELPKNWGLIEPYGDGLRVKTVAPKMEATPITNRFLAAILRKAKDCVTDEGEVLERISKAVKDALTERNKSHKDNDMYYKGLYEKLQSKVRNFEAKSGVGLEYTYNLDDAAAALKCLVHSHPDALIQRLASIQNQAEQVVNSAATGIAALSKMGSSLSKVDNDSVQKFMETSKC